MKVKILTFIGVMGSWIASLFGGWDAALVTLLIFMGIDYVTGLMGVPIPAVIVRAIEDLKKKAESEE